MGTWSDCRKYHHSSGFYKQSQSMLKTLTEKQKTRILEILDKDRQVISSESNGVCIDGFISFDDMAEVVGILRSPADTQKELFEECWVAYGRKGIKKKSYEYWCKLKENEKTLVMPHIKAYVASREPMYQKDFERYLRDKVFNTVVYNGNNIVYDPTKSSSASVQSEVYMPTCGGALSWNDYYGCYMYTGYWSGRISDGYTDYNRPDGASVTLSNGRGDAVWNKESKTWNLV